MTANGEVQTRKEATVYVKELDLFVTVMLLEETPAVLSLGKLCEDHGYTCHWTSGPKPHLTKNGKRIHCNIANCVPFVVPGLSTSSSTSSSPVHRRILWSARKIQQQKEVKLWVRSPGETRRVDQQKPKTQIKMKQPKKNYEVNYCKICRNGHRISRRIWWIRMFNRINSLPALSMNYPWSREQKVVPGARKHSIFSHFPKNRNCDICLRTKITRASCRRRIGTAVHKAESVGDLIPADHKVLGEGCESRHNHRYAVVVQDLATQWLQSYPCKTKTSQETQKSRQKFWSRQGNHKSFTLTIP